MRTRPNFWDSDVVFSRDTHTHSNTQLALKRHPSAARSVFHSHQEVHPHTAAQGESPSGPLSEDGSLFITADLKITRLDYTPYDYRTNRIRNIRPELGTNGRLGVRIPLGQRNIPLRTSRTVNKRALLHQQGCQRPDANTGSGKGHSSKNRRGRYSAYTPTRSE